jgi:hypothetical protein
VTARKISSPRAKTGQPATKYFVLGRQEFARQRPDAHVSATETACTFSCHFRVQVMLRWSNCGLSCEDCDPGRDSPAKQPIKGWAGVGRLGETSSGNMEHRCPATTPFPRAPLRGLPH